MKRFLFIFCISSLILLANDEKIQESLNNNNNLTQEEILYESRKYDPLSGYNRAMTQFNYGFYSYVTKPIAKGYAYVMPAPVRVGIDNFFTNLLFPVRFVNNLLQLKFKNASKELGRFLINTIWGFGGFMDQATHTVGMDIYRENFGSTLAYWGVGEGVHIVLPFFGPSNLRDAFGSIFDVVLSPTQYTGHNTIPYKIPQKIDHGYAIATTYSVNLVSFDPDSLDKLSERRVDLYEVLKYYYNQKRDEELRKTFETGE
ncbi:VacJ family lipoprotein [Aliarcobacter thereius]|uniref:VacJ family lipoprotein n=1 Tax=Aliarcobacter thereius TaxID=544718 RepID=A0A5R9GZM1_9BACT|nr:VacJ family lipoprotein [Aliarcobacter thereius]TLS71813.1 VacJ family lipoprotein [Aliarcobacter thereius]